MESREQAQLAKQQNQSPIVDDVVMPDTEEDSPSQRKDFVNESMFGIDDQVVLRNILDGTTRGGSGKKKIKMPKASFIFSYNGAQFKVKPGQVFTLPGARAYLCVKHLVSLIYRRVENKPELDKRTYPLDDIWVSQVVVKIHETLTPNTRDENQLHEIPDYIEQDERLKGAMGSGGDVAIGAIDPAKEAVATDEDIDKIPDFDEKLNPRFQVKNGKPTKQEKQSVQNVE